MKLGTVNGNSTMSDKTASSSLLCRFRGIIGVAQDRPIDIWPQILTAHGSSGSALNPWAVLSGNIPPLNPVIDNLLGNADRTGEAGLASCNLNGFVERLHGANNSTWGSHVNTWCLTESEWDEAIGSAPKFNPLVFLVILLCLFLFAAF